MTDPLLRTKLCMPPVRSELVRRDRLLERLGAGLPCTERRTVWRGDGFQRQLTLVSAPAGYGKTTLVVEWLSQKDEGRRMKDETIPPSSFILPVWPGSRSTKVTVKEKNAGLRLELTVLAS